MNTYMYPSTAATTQTQLIKMTSIIVMKVSANTTIIKMMTAALLILPECIHTQDKLYIHMHFIQFVYAYAMHKYIYIFIYVCTSLRDGIAEEPSR